jgi:tetratricopeptide (TPR) repeat protein/transglutaminase-like putative cysteine protease
MRVVALFLAGCASLPAVPRVPAPALVHGGSGPEVDRLVEEFYGDGLQPEAAVARAAEVLQRYPDAARAHEVAGFAAMLLGDGEGAWRHFLRAAADLDGDATEIYLWELGGNQPRSQAEAAADLYRALMASHPRQNVRAYAAARLARFYDDYGRFADEEALPLGPIREWQLLGALDNDQGKGFLAAFPQERLDLAAEVPGPLVTLKWRRVERLTRDGRVPLANLLWPQEFGVAWLVTWVRSDREQAAQLRLSTSSPTRAYINDALVLSEEHVAASDADNLVGPVLLHAGWNQVLIKSAHRRGAWSLRARFTDGEGAPLELQAVAAPQQYLPGEATKGRVRIEAEFGGPEGRRHVLESQREVRAGRARPALTALQPFLDAHPRNLLGQYLGALAYWDNEELGKAIDLLNQGVEATHSRAAGFLLKRGRYYLQRQLWEKAQSDLIAAVPLSPRSGRIALADLFEKRAWTVDRGQVLQEILDRWPDHVWALRERAECLDALGYSAESEKLLERAAAWQPGDDEIWARLYELARRRGDLSQAKKYLSLLANADPVNAARLLDQADLSRRMGNTGGAIALLEAAARQVPEWPRPWERMGNLYYERGRRAEALAAWKRAHERDPNNTALAQRIEFLEPTRLGFIEQYVPSEAELDAAVQQKPKALSIDKGAQVVILFDHEVTEVNADGSSRRVVSLIQQAVDEKGRDAMTRERLPTSGTLKLLKAYAVSDKGERQEASSIRGGEVRFRNLQAGSRTVLQYVHYMPPSRILPNSFASTWFFQSLSKQHEDSTWVLVLPRGRTLHTRRFGEVEEKRLSDGEHEVRIFHAGRLPPIVFEQNMPPPEDLLAQVAVSTVESWDEYVRWERALLADAFNTNPALDALTDKLLGGAKSPREKLDKLYHHVVSEVRYQQDYESTIAGVRPHSAPSVVERGYGDCKDKAVLLIQMARRAGLELQFALLRTTPHGKVLREVPNQQFNHAIVYVPPQAGIAEGFFLDPTSDGLDLGNLRNDDQGALSLVMDPRTGKWEWREIPYQSADVEYDHHKIRIQVKSPAEADATDELSLRGAVAMGLRRVLRNQGEARRLLEMLAAAMFPGATVRDLKFGDREDLWHPLAITLEVDGSHALHAEDEHFRLDLPVSFRLERLVTLAKRDTPLHLGAPDSSSLDIEALLPEGYEMHHAPKDFSVRHACFSYSRKSKVEARRLLVHYDYSRQCTEVAPDVYPDFRKSVQQASQSLGDHLLFTRKK